jgi:hypothetical protein
LGSLLLVFATLIAAVALQQLAATRSSQTSGQADRAAALAVANDFGRELTTYDYAHAEPRACCSARCAGRAPAGGSTTTDGSRRSRKA